MMDSVVLKHVLNWEHRTHQMGSGPSTHASCFQWWPKQDASKETLRTPQQAEPRYSIFYNIRNQNETYFKTGLSHPLASLPKHLPSFIITGSS